MVTFVLWSDAIINEALHDEASLRKPQNVQQVSEYQQLTEKSAEKYAPTLEEQNDTRHRHRPSFFKTIQIVFVKYISEPLGTAKRFLVLACIFLPVLLTAPMIFIGSKRDRGKRRGRKVASKEEGERWGALWWYRYLVVSLEAAGPTFIKLAQWAGSRQDLFPKELCDMFGKLHSNGKPHSLAYTKDVIEKVFGGRKFEDIFDEFQEDPMGIGAVAQVYKAKLKPDLLPPSFLEAKHPSPKKQGVGKAQKAITTTLALNYDEDEAPPKIPTGAVAIKILHPKVERTIARDIKIMSFFAHALNLLPGAEWLSFPEEVNVFAGMMFSQLDLRNEAENLLRFEENFGKRRSAVNFPRPLPRFSTKELLIEEFEDALPLKYFLNLGGAGYDHRIANLGLDTFLNMLLVDNFTHADLHPGNIMVKFYRATTESLLKDLSARILARFDNDYAPGAKKGQVPLDELTDESVLERLRPLKDDQDAWLDELTRLDEMGYQPELVFLDAGLTVELSPINRRNFLELFGAVAEFDGALAGRLMVERCRMPDLVIDEETFALRMQDVVLSVKSKTFSLAQIKISDVLSQVLAAVRKHHVKMEPDFVNTVISILLLEGIGRQLDPDMDLFKSALPILRSLGRQLSHSPSMLGGGGTGEGKMSLKDVFPMLKVWLYLEARAWVGSLAQRNTVEAFVRYDWLSTGV
ncbi:ABC1-domain-containing protein [Tilletiaria anomala UBC 951]|uniref:ABC1-domain-containing protein n=1 Tax=Tilletiaria anomala (strain ATCC 24038 / CBS 436.72 / UBC 951) TaxID=1037660 RepID=A0A066VTE2_TILAU|nr:ABC1-domain-containing protein [Tilletiaria anomala UBC 951]KDN44741.1 ABC1-domain-containing protein [Tilletiaria anomala UBC 951]